jgi:signal transduction histidine kinase
VTPRVMGVRGFFGSLPESKLPSLHEGRMPKQLSLRAKVFFVVGSLFLVILTSGSFSVWMNYRVGAVCASVVNGNVAALHVAQNLETSLSLQSVLLNNFLVDGQRSWLNELEQQRRSFGDALKAARDASPAGDLRDALNEIESKALRYGYLQDRLIKLREEGKSEGGLGDSSEVDGQFRGIRELCEAYKRSNEERMGQALAAIQEKSQTLNILLLAVLPAIVLLGLALVYLVINQVLDPIRELVYTTSPGGKPGHIDNEVEALSRRVHRLMEDVDQTQSQLQISREHLLQSGKLAMVGKLAAGVAHSVRNPLTSVKMRMFSLGRSLKLSPDQKEDFEVISNEIRHIDTILQNFLEFSRPPKLKVQKVSPSDVVDAAIQLLRHRIESYEVAVELYRKRRLPEIEGDPEQLKEVLVNLIINACEAMTGGGKILIQEEDGFTEPMGRVAVIKISDNGPGISESIGDRVFQPFFSTKEEGTGLGLSIAVRIIEDHQGCLNLRSRRGKGTTFTITLPSKEGEAWLRS